MPSRRTRSIPTNRFLFEIALGYACNFDCKYCFERNRRPEMPSKISYEVICISFKYIDELLKNNQKILIRFWGGEPFLYFEEMKKFFLRYKKYQDKVYYHINTNGYDIYKKIMTLPIEVQNQLRIAVSYDFEPLQSLNRGHNKEILETIGKLDNNKNIVSAVHAACFSEDYGNYLFETYKSFYKLSSQYPKTIYKLCLTNSFINDVDKIDCEKVRNEILKINNFLLKNKIEDPKFLLYNNIPLKNIDQYKEHCHILRPNAIFLDSDGKLYMCHGCSYHPCGKNYFLGESKNYNTLSELYEEIGDFKQYIKIPEKCKTCENTFCIFCPMQQNRHKDQKFPNIVLDQPCSDEEFEFYKTVSEATGEFYKSLPGRQI